MRKMSSGDRDQFAPTSGTLIFGGRMIAAAATKRHSPSNDCCDFVFQSIDACGNNQHRRNIRKPRLPDPNGDLVRDDRRTERIVSGVTQNQLQGMLAGWQFDARLGLACSKMKM